MMISVIIPTIGRMDTLDRLLASLKLQTFLDFEVIIVDQSKNRALIQIVNIYAQYMRIRHIVQDGSGSSLARNEGGYHAEGEILFWPDDDCLLTQTKLLELVDRKFQLDKELGGIVAMAKSEDGIPFHRWNAWQIRNLSKVDAFTRTPEWTIFVRREIFNSLGGFDTNFGPGESSLWGAGESADLCIRILCEKHRIILDPEIYVNHPNPAIQNDQQQLRKGYVYAEGMGAVIAKNNLPLGVILKYLWTYIRALLWNILLCKRANIKFHWYRLRGVIRGWCEYSEVIQRQRTPASRRTNRIF